MTSFGRPVCIALLLAASCAKRSKETAPAEGAASNAAPAMADPPPVQQGSGEGGSRDEALAKARNEAILGPSAPTEAFDPLPDTEKGGSKAKIGAVAKTGGGGGTRNDTSDAPKLPAPGGTRGDSDYRAQIGVVALADSHAEISSDLVRSVKVRGPDVQACYDKALVKSPGLAGMLRLAFTVTPTGAVTAAKVTTTTLKNIELESCVVAVLQGVKLAKPLGAADAEANVTITFAKTKH